MQNWSQVFADTLALYESCYVPGDQGDAGKGQVCVRAGLTIYQMFDLNVGYIRKNPGQTQFNGVSVDALLDKSDGTWADYLTDELQPDGTRLIKLAYSPHNEPVPPGTPLPPLDWVQPIAAYLEYPGPLVLIDDEPDPDPAPGPDPDIDTVLARLDVLEQQMIDLASQQTVDTSAIMDAVAEVGAKVDRNEARFNDVVSDVEDGLRKLGILLYLRRPEVPDDES